MSDTIGTAVRHPWNIDFEWKSPPGRERTLDQTQIEQFDASGYVVLPGVIDAEFLDRVVEELDEFERERDALLAREPNGRSRVSERGSITFTGHLVARSPLLRRLTHHPTLVDICADLIGDDVDLYWDQAVYKKPEKPRRFPWHQDNGYTFVLPQQYLTFWIALVDATLDNGCPVVAPGFHRLGTLEHHYVDPLGWECLTDPEGAVVTEVKAGGAVAFSSLTPHLTGPNRTDAVRKAYIVQYAPHGAAVLRGDPAAGPPTHRDPCDSPELNYAVLRAGIPVGVHDGGTAR